MTPEEKFILLMEAAYAAPDKETYHALMQQADRILKENQVAMDHLNSEAAWTPDLLKERSVPTSRPMI